jgi:hypothetical protein
MHGCQNPWQFWWLLTGVMMCRYLGQFLKWAQMPFPCFQTVRFPRRESWELFFTAAIYMAWRMQLICYRWLQSFAFFALSISYTHFALAPATKGSFAFFLKYAMARVRSTACPRDVVAGSECHGSRDSSQRTEFAQLCDVGSHNRAGADTDEGWRT